MAELNNIYMKPDFVIPISVQQTKKKRFSLNLNQYRNAHFRTLSTVKKRYKESLDISNKKIKTPCMMLYRFYIPQN